MKHGFAYLVSYSFFLVTTFSCVGNPEFDAPKKSCNSTLMSNTTFEEVLELFKEGTVQVTEDLVVEGYVISSDRAGNFFSTLYLQDKPTSPTGGFQIEMDVRESHLFYEVGSKVLVKLKGLFLQAEGSSFKVGGSFSAFGNISVGRLPSLKVPEHVFLSCSEFEQLEPVAANIADIESLKANTLVSFDGLEIVEMEQDSTFAIAGEETERTLKDCDDNTIMMLNSGFSDFQADVLPGGNGRIIGILLKDGKGFQIVIRDLEDIEFTNDRCPEIITEFTSNSLFISELADPNNNAGARFVELYNSGAEPLDLNKWTLRRYTNANTEVSSIIDLSGFIIGAESTFVISPNAEEFELIYGFQPDLGVSTNSPADSNGDDNLELVDPFGTVIDMYGVVGEDGSNTNHEFEDGRALRNINISQGNPVYTFSEWTIYNDTGDVGTINQPQNAPEDFSPGARE